MAINKSIIKVIKFNTWCIYTSIYFTHLDSAGTRFKSRIDREKNCFSEASVGINFVFVLGHTRGF